MALRNTNGLSINPINPPIGVGNILKKVSPIKQEKGEWCWAACAVMVLRHYDDKEVQQCHLAKLFFPSANCCDLSSPSCNTSCKVGDVRAIYQIKGIRCIPSSGSVPFNILQTEIDAGRPVEVYLSRGLNGHLIIIRGWYINGADLYALVIDPINGGHGAVAYTYLLNGKFGIWAATWTGLRR